MKWNRIEMFKFVVLVYIKYMNYKGAERESTFLSEVVKMLQRGKKWPLDLDRSRGFYRESLGEVKL